MRLLFTAALCLVLSSCASTPSAVTPPSSAAKAAQGLSPQKLGPGECGLFIWTADAERRFIIFSQSETQSGVWNHDGQDINLKITGQSGEPANRQFPNTDYAAETDITLSVNLQSREPINDGTRFKTGTLKIAAPGEWDRVVPIAALSACQPR